MLPFPWITCELAQHLTTHMSCWVDISYCWPVACHVGLTYLTIDQSNALLGWHIILLPSHMRCWVHIFHYWPVTCHAKLTYLTIDQSHAMLGWHNLLLTSHMQCWVDIFYYWPIIYYRSINYLSYYWVQDKTLENICYSYTTVLAPINTIYWSHFLDSKQSYSKWLLNSELHFKKIKTDGPEEAILINRKYLGVVTIHYYPICIWFSAISFLNISIMSFQERDFYISVANFIVEILG